MNTGVHIQLSFKRADNPIKNEQKMEKEMATHSSILAWEIPWTEKSSGLQSMGSQTVRHDLVTKQQQRYLFILT